MHALTKVDPLPQSSSGNPPGHKDHTECFIFFMQTVCSFPQVYWGSKVEMLNFNSLYDILSENHNIS